jgi:hypothetical protein
MSRPAPNQRKELEVSIAVSGIANPPPLDAMSGASAGMPPQQKMSGLFDKIDANGSGSIT